MLENARRQAILVLLTILAGLACNFLITPGLGADLKGGSQLIYEVPQEVLDKLVQGGQGQTRTTIDSVMDQTVTVIRERIDPTGVLDALVSRRGATGVLIELPWMPKDQLDLVKARIASLGKLEMRVVATDDFQGDGVSFELAKEKQRLEDWLKQGGRELVRGDYKKIELFNDDPQHGPLAFPNLRWYPHLIEPKQDNPKAWEPSFSFDTSSEAGITPLGPATVTVFDQATEWNGGLVPEALARQQHRALLEFVAINMKERAFRGEDLDPASVQPGVAEDGRLAVRYAIKPELSADYGDWSQKYLKKHSAIILNGVVRSAPYFQSRIPGNGQISGAFTESEVQELVKVLRTGSLQVEPQLLSSRTQGPNLGEHMLHLGEISLVAGSAAVFLFMLWYYRLAGVVACVTLVLNVFLLWSSLLFMQATVTLPGLGGIVLTLGMAVDANVLVYERIREESERGKDMVRSVRAGFERAMSAILDSNITTFLTGLVLYNVGVGPVRGFAVTLMVGIVTTVFTQFFVTRLLFHYLLVRKKLTDFKVKRLFAQPKFDYLRHARACMIGSVLLITAGSAYSILGVPSEVSLGIDFKGGANMQMLLREPTTAQLIRDRLDHDAQFNADFRNFKVNTIDPAADGTSRTFNIRLKLTDAMREQIERARAEWRETKKAAEQRSEAPPPPYSPPYVEHLRRIFAAELASPAWSNAQVNPDAQGRTFAQIDLHFQAPVDLAAMQKKLEEAKLPSVRVKSPLGQPESTTGKDAFVEWATQQHQWELFPTVRDALAAFKDVNGNEVQLSDPFPEAEEIQGRMVGELRNAAIGALILSWALMIFYLRVRFHEYKYGIAAVAALVHDVLVACVGVVIANALDIVHAEIDLNMIACFLTIIGYSVNDTIVIFDRIRENMQEEQKLGGNRTFREVINLSVNQTMSRTILTSGVTLFVVLAQFLVNWGTDSDLGSFAFGMLLGMISGTYSTIWIASPILVWIQDRERKSAPPAPAQAPVTVPQ